MDGVLCILVYKVSFKPICMKGGNKKKKVYVWITEKDVTWMQI